MNGIYTAAIVFTLAFTAITDTVRAQNFDNEDRKLLEELETKSRNGRLSPMEDLKLKQLRSRRYLSIRKTVNDTAETQKSHIENLLEKKEKFLLKGFSDELSPAGREQLKKALLEYPEFERDYFIEEFHKQHNRVEQFFPPEKLAKVENEAEKLYPPIKKGELIQVETRFRSYKGPFGGMYGNKIKVGYKLIPVTDIPGVMLDRMDPVRLQNRKKQYVYRNYTLPRKKYLEKLDEALKKHLDGKYEPYSGEKQKAIETVFRELKKSYPALREKTLDQLLCIPQIKLRDKLKEKIEDEYSRAQPLFENQRQTLQKIITDISKDNPTLCVWRGKLTTKSYSRTLEKNYQEKLKAAKQKK